MAIKVEITYPTIPTRRWRPPWRPHVAKPFDRKPIKRKPMYPKMHKMVRSSLLKIWHHYRVLKNFAVLFGKYSQNDIRYPPKFRGKQGPANCFAAIGFTQLRNVGKWDANSIGYILQTGTKLYEQTIGINKNICDCTSPKELHPEFFIEDTIFVMNVDDDTLYGTLYETEGENYLKTEIKKVFPRTKYCIFEVEGKFMAIWKSSGSYYIFDPNDIDENCQRTQEGMGVAVVLKFLNVNKLVKHIQQLLAPEEETKYFTIHYLYIKSFVKENLIPPYALEDIIGHPKRRQYELAAAKSCLATKEKIVEEIIDEPKIGPVPPAAGTAESVAHGKKRKRKRSGEDEEIPPEEPINNIPSLEALLDEEKVEAHPELIPVERPQVPPSSYYQTAIPGKLTILIGTCHQHSNKCTKFEGKQALGNAIAAVGMLRQYKSKFWYPKLIDEILLTGETIYIHSRQNFIGNQELNLKNVVKKFSINRKDYEHDIEEMTMIGQLGSEVASILDLKAALAEFFYDNSAAIIRGPLLLAVWFEENKYYMFDPNERNKKGRKIEQDPDSPDTVPEKGCACVTCFTSVEDLANLYSHNVCKEYKRDHFYISKILIKNFVEKPDQWMNYNPVSVGTWILRGTFSQNNLRFAAPGRNQQSVCMSTLAIGIHKMNHCTDWDRAMVDELLVEGDKYYRATLDYLKAKELFVHESLLMKEVYPRHPYKDKVLNFIVDECVINGTFNVVVPVDAIPNLEEGLQMFFKDYESGVLTARTVALGFWKFENFYYYFDSHGRDDCGLADEGGLACVMRFETIPQMTESMVASFSTLGIDFYNLSGITVEIWKQTKDGQVKPNFHNYIEISPKKGILRASSHQGDETLFDYKADKQGIANLLTALGMTTIIPSEKWQPITMDQILQSGDKHFEKSRVEIIKKDLEDIKKWEKTDVPPIDYNIINNENVLKEMNLGANKLTFQFKDEEKVEGIFEPDRIYKDAEGNREYQDIELYPVLKTAFEEGPPIKERPKREMILDSEHMSCAMWKHDEMYYLFDPKGKNYEGNCFGRDLWSAKIIISDEDYEMAEEEEPIPEPVVVVETTKGKKGKDKKADKKESAKKEKEKKEEKKEPPKEEPKVVIVEPPKIEEPKIPEEIEEEEILDEEILFPYKIDISDACAYTAVFTTFDELYTHIIENVRPNKRTEKFILYPIVVISVPNLKVFTNAINKELSKWYNFDEVEKDKWILRGTMTLMDQTFPKENRGRQYVAMCLAASVYSRLYSIIKFTQSTVNDILKYGDKLHTCCLRKIEQKIRESCDLSEQEIRELARSEDLKTSDFPNEFLLGEYHVMLSNNVNLLDGDTSIHDNIAPPSVATVEGAPESKKRRVSRSRISRSRMGVTITPTVKDEGGGAPDIRIEVPKLSIAKVAPKMIEYYQHNILNAKGLSFAFWNMGDFFYLFDPDARGPSGLMDPNGSAFIMRFTNLNDLVLTIQNILPKEGSCHFWVDGIGIKSRPANRPQQSIPDVLPINPNMTAFHMIDRDRHILRGNFHQNNAKFNVPENSTSACNAIVALAMAQIHPPERWTRPIVDDVVLNAYNLYKQSVDTLGYEFNEWEDKMVLDLVDREFSIGVITVNWEVIPQGMQRGILVIKSLDIPSLRKSCDNFFFEYNFGIIQSEALTVAAWVTNNVYYMFDPNPRGQTGIYSSGGTACLMIFSNIRTMLDHYIANVPPRLQKEEFVIYPVDIVTMETKPKKAPPPMKKADILKVKEIDSLSGYVDKEKKKKMAPNDDPQCDKTRKEDGPSRSHSKNPNKKAKSTKDPCCCVDKSKTIPHKTRTIDEMKCPFEPSSPEAKKEWLRMKMEAKRLKDLKFKEHRLRTSFYDLDNGEAIVRAHYSQSSPIFSALSRNKQTHANALVSIVMFKLHEPKTWSYKNIEIILESGDVLFKDSYIKYRPLNPLLGLRNLLRTFYLYHLKITTIMYKPFVFGDCHYEDLYVGLLNFFMSETAGIIVCTPDSFALAVFQKSGQYYMFDPHDRDVKGDVTDTPGCACLLRFDNLEGLVEKYMRNAGIDSEAEEVPRFYVCAAGIDSVEKISRG